MMGFRKPAEEKMTGSCQVSRVVGSGKQGSEETTMAVDLCDGKNSRVISGEEGLDSVVASERVLICLPSVL